MELLLGYLYEVLAGETSKQTVKERAQGWN